MSDTPRDFSRELYPFLYAPSGAVDGATAGLLEAVRQSTLAKCDEVIALRNDLLEEYDEQLVVAAEAMARRIAEGGTLLTLGNGGSATDADDAAMDCVSPPVAGWRSIPAVSLSSDSATITALSNDVGYHHVYSRQVAALGLRGDVAIGFSTSGNSTSIVDGMLQARRRGLMTIAFCGYDGGEVARAGTVDFCFVSRREFVPRIQEGHATLWHSLLELVQASLAEIQP